MTNRHNPHQPSCSNCRFLKIIVTDRSCGWTEHQCRRRSPQVVSESDPRFMAGASTPTTRWPVVIDADWCGEWEAKS